MLFLIYLAGIVDIIKLIFIMLFFILLVVFGFVVLVHNECLIDDKPPKIQYNKFYFSLIIILFIGLFTPTSNSIYLIIGASTTKQFMNNTTEGDKVNKILNLSLDKIINNLQESN